VQPEIRAVIADDEALARMRLRRLCELSPGVSVVAEAEDGDAALRCAAEHRPDLLFLDVSMPGKNGLSVAAELDPAARPLLVYVTAYREYAVSAFEVQALDYLLKPFDKERFAETIARVRARLGSPGASGSEATADGAAPLTSATRGIAAPSANVPRLERLAVKAGSTTRFLELRDVDCVTAEGNYVSVQSGDKSYLVRETMNAMEASLDPGSFVRVHRSAIVRIDRIDEIEPVASGEYVLRLRGGKTIAAARTYRQRLLHALGIGR
jgi:two-component system LytT family response regulator